MTRRWLPVLALVACTEAMPEVPEATSHVQRIVIPLRYRPELDLLFVIDNSPAMAPHREVVLANARGFASVLRSIGPPPDLHLGVITTDVGARGALDVEASPHGDCTAEGDAGRLRRVAAVAGAFATDVVLDDGTRQGNYTGSLADVLEAMLDAGTSGCSIPRPLEAVRRALAHPANAGFRRPTARLGIVFLTSQDDCSFEHADFLDGATPANCALRDGLVALDELEAVLRSEERVPGHVGLSGAFGPAEDYVVLDGSVRPSCAVGARSNHPVAPGLPAPERSALPAIRLQALLDRFPSLATTLCQQDLSGVLGLFTGFGVSFVNPCLPQPPADIDPETPGDQHACAAWIERRDTDPVTIEALRPCDRAGPGQRCWRLEIDARACPEPGSGYLFALGDPYAVPPARELAILECVTR